MFPCSLQYELNLLHIILKFTLHSWQVPRSSVGRALYRESGPSQDGDPVPGNLPFFLFFLFFYFYSFFNVLFGRFFSFPSLYENQKKCKVSVYPSFYFITLAKVFFHLLASLPFSYTPKLGTCIGMLLDRNVIKLNIFFCRKIVL